MSYCDETTLLIDRRASSTRYTNAEDKQNIRTKDDVSIVELPTEITQASTPKLQSSVRRSQVALLYNKRLKVSVFLLFARFSFWNMLMGTSLLSMPWAFREAGLAQGIAIQIIMCTIAVYTAYLLLSASQKMADPVSKKMPELLEICRVLIGPWAGWMSIVGSIVILGGALIVYWILMAQLLYNSVCSIYYFVLQSHGREGNFSHNETTVQCAFNSTTINLNSSGIPTIPGWSKDVTVPLFLIPVFLPIMQFKQMTIFSKLGAFGTMTVIFLLAVVLAKALTWGWNADFITHNSIHFVPQSLSSFPALSGVLGMGYFIHNSITTVFRNNRHPENNVRDLTIGYVLVFFTYVLVGLGIYLSFPENKSCIHQNFLENFASGDWMSLATQLAILLRMFTVYPIVSYILRVQVFIAFFGKDYPGKLEVFLLNLVIVSACVLCAIFYPRVGDIIRYAGAFCGMLIMFFLPCAIHMILIGRNAPIGAASAVIHFLLVLLGIFNFLGQFFVPG